MQSLKRCSLFPVSPCTKYITHSCGVISASPFLLRRHTASRDIVSLNSAIHPFREIGRYRKKSLSGKFGSVGVETSVVHESNHVFSFCSMDGGVRVKKLYYRNNIVTLFNIKSIYSSHFFDFIVFFYFQRGEKNLIILFFHFINIFSFYEDLFLKPLFL